jgi:hypothetical protein
MTRTIVEVFRKRLGLTLIEVSDPCSIVAAVDIHFRAWSIEHVAWIK